jgi:truncated hemoglobin YjbI
MGHGTESSLSVNRQWLTRHLGCLPGLVTGIDDDIERLAGVSRERALRVDEVNLYERLGEDTMLKLSRNFYTRVFNDEVQWFRNIFKGRDIEEAIQNQVDFFVQRFGGPAKFSQRKGHPALIARHINFNMNQKAAERWLCHMRAAFDDTPEIDADSRGRMLDFFAHTAYFLHLGVTQRK